MKHERLCRTSTETCDCCHTAKADWRLWQLAIIENGGGSTGCIWFACAACYQLYCQASAEVAPTVKEVVVLV